MLKPEMIGILGILVLLVLVLIRFQVGLALLLVGFVGFIILNDFNVALSNLGRSAIGTLQSQSLSVIPMFIMMGLFLSSSGMAKDMFNAIDKWLGNLKGGLGIATIATSAIFSSISGSASATTSTLAKITIPEMRSYNYNDRLSTSTVAAGGTLGFLIPPSTIMIIYGVLTMENIGELLIAGLIPGIFMTLIFMTVIHVQVRLNPSLAPLTNKAGITLRDKVKSLQAVWPFAVVFLVSIGGIYLGVFTATEAGAVGALGSLLVSGLTRRLTFNNIFSAMDETVRLSCMIFIILIGASLFGQFLAASRLPIVLTSWVGQLDLSAYVVLLFILIVLLILGLFMESIAILVITIPILYPLIIDLGFDGIWFGVIMCLAINIGMITPPLGISVYIVHGVTKIPLETIFRGIIPMLLGMLLMIVLLIIVPEIALYLPKMMRN